jgi:hypothetical protein
VPLAVGQIEHLSWVQNGSVGFEKNNIPYVKSNICGE